MTYNIMIEHLSHHKLLLGTSSVASFSARREENLAISDLRGKHTPKLHTTNDFAIFLAIRCYDMITYYISDVCLFHLHRHSA